MKLEHTTNWYEPSEEELWTRCKRWTGNWIILWKARSALKKRTEASKTSKCKLPFFFFISLLKNGVFILYFIIVPALRESHMQWKLIGSLLTLSAQFIQFGESWRSNLLVLRIQPESCALALLPIFVPLIIGSLILTQLVNISSNN